MQIVWNCDDGGKYYIRQFGSIVWWYGEHDPNTPDWSNVMRGSIGGNTINADWTDVPKGSIMQYGTLKSYDIIKNAIDDFFSPMTGRHPPAIISGGRRAHAHIRRSAELTLGG